MNEEQINKFSSWSIFTLSKYGDLVNIWWKEKGCEDFLIWAKNKHNVEYIKETT